MRHLKKRGTCLSGQRFRQQVLGEKSTKDMEEVPTNFTTGFFLKENEFYQSTAQYLDLTSGNRVIQSQTVSLSLYFSVT